jgi:hypothetical protein
MLVKAIRCTEDSASEIRSITDEAIVPLNAARIEAEA